MDTELKWVDLTEMENSFAADLLAAFLEDGEVEFQMLGRTDGDTCGPLSPSTDKKVTFRVPEPEIERAKELVEEYMRAQQAEAPASEFPEFPSENGGGAADDE